VRGARDIFTAKKRRIGERGRQEKTLRVGGFRYRQAFLAYFFLNLSIRPVVSRRMFCPVKKGCEVLEISSLMMGY